MARNRGPPPLYNGVYRVWMRKGNIALIPGTQNIVFPGWPGRSTSRAISTFTEVSPFGPKRLWPRRHFGRVPEGQRNGRVWLRPTTCWTGWPANPCFRSLSGANGIASTLATFIVINTGQRGPRRARPQCLPDGSPGPNPEPVEARSRTSPGVLCFYQEPGPFPLMLDGLALGTVAWQNVYIAVPSRLAVVRINAAGSVSGTLAVFPQAAARWAVQAWPSAREWASAKNLWVVTGFSGPGWALWFPGPALARPRNWSKLEIGHFPACRFAFDCADSLSATSVPAALASGALEPGSAMCRHAM